MIGNNASKTATHFRYYTIAEINWHCGYLYNVGRLLLPTHDWEFMLEDHTKENMREKLKGSLIEKKYRKILAISSLERGRYAKMTVFYISVFFKSLVSRRLGPETRKGLLSDIRRVKRLRGVDLSSLIQPVQGTLPRPDKVRSVQIEHVLEQLANWELDHMHA